MARAIERNVEREAAEWAVSTRAAWSLAVGPLVVAALIALTIPNRALYAAIIEEDGIVEWAQMGALLGLVILGAAITGRLLARRRVATGLLYLIATVATVFILGEEISWGQRILGWATPEDLANLNRQGETNIHNIGQTLRVMNLLMMTAAFVAVAVPVAWRIWAGYRTRHLEEYLLVPPLFLATSFLFAAAYRLVRVTFVPEGRFVISHFQEVAELAFYFALVVFAFLVFRRLRRDRI